LNFGVMDLRLGRLQAKQGLIKASRESFRRAMEVGGAQSAVTLQANALLEAQAGDLGQARHLFQEAVREYCPLHADCVDTTSKKCATQQQELYHRAIEISSKSNL
jgi:hypothetical protein